MFCPFRDGHAPACVVASVAAAVVVIHAGPLCAADANLRGRTVPQALAALEMRGGIRFLFSNQLVSDGLRVRDEPRASEDAAQIAREILAVHGLGLDPVQPGLYAVIRIGPPQPPVATAAAPTMPVELSEVMVSASRYQVGDATSSITFVSPQTLTQTPALAADPVRALGRLPGFARDGYSARTHVRGGEESEVLTLLDGFPLRDAVHLPGYGGFFSVFDAQLLRGATVFTGGFPALYGNRMSGVLDLRTIDATSAPRRSLAVDFFNASARAGGEIGASLDYLALARAGMMRPLLEVFDPDVTRPSYGDAYLRVGFPVTDALRVTGNLLWSRDELGIRDAERAEHAVVHGGRRYAWLQGDLLVNDDLNLRLWAGQSQLEATRDGTVAREGIVDGAVFDERRASILEAKGLAEWRLTGRLFVQSGFEVTDEHARYRYDASARYSPAVSALFDREPTLARDLDLRPVRRRLAVFASNRWRITDAVTSELGARAQRLVTRGQETDWITEPRASLRWQLASGTDLRASWGQFNQIDDVNELAVEDGVTRFPAPQRSEHFIVGAQRRLSERWALRVEAFHKRQTHPRVRYENVLDPQTILAEIAPDRVALEPDSAHTHGVELTADYARDGVDASLSASWSRAHDRFAGDSVPRSWDQPWGLTGSLAWTRGRWLWSATAEVHRGWPRTRLIATAGEASRLGERNGDRLPLFRQLDLKMQHTRPLQLGELVFSLDVINAQVRPNTCCTELGLDPVTGRLVGSRAVWFPLIPSLGVRWNY